MGAASTAADSAGSDPVIAHSQGRSPPFDRSDFETSAIRPIPARGGAPHCAVDFYPRWAVCDTAIPGNVQVRESINTYLNTAVTPTYMLKNEGGSWQKLLKNPLDDMSR